MFTGDTTIFFSSLQRQFLNYMYADISFEASVVVINHVLVLWVVTLCSFVDSYQLSAETRSLCSVDICLQDNTVSQTRQSEVFSCYTEAIFETNNELQVETDADSKF
jgi:hypothetical protein